jgi:hypothetical protein
MAKWQLLWSEPSRYWETLTEDIATADQAISRLEELERFWDGEQLCISPRLRAGDGEQMYVGLAGDSWLLMHVGTGDCEFSWAVGNLTADGTIWVYFPADTEVSRKCLVPRATAQQALREWLELGRLGGEIAWTDDYTVVS